MDLKVFSLTPKSPKEDFLGLRNIILVLKLAIGNRSDGFRVSKPPAKIGENIGAAVTCNLFGTGADGFSVKIPGVPDFC